MGRLGWGILEDLGERIFVNGNRVDFVCGGTIRG